MLFNNEKIYTKQQPKILQYWITNEISPCLKKPIVKIITLNNSNINNNNNNNNNNKKISNK